MHWLVVPIVGHVMYLFMPKNSLVVGLFLLGNAIFMYLVGSQLLYYLLYVVPYFLEEICRMLWVVNGVGIIGIYLTVFTMAMTHPQWIREAPFFSLFFKQNWLTFLLVKENALEPKKSSLVLQSDLSDFLRK